MAIFGDVNDNRVIPLLLLSGIIFMTGMYLIYFYKWIASIFCGSHSISKIHIQQELKIPFDSFVDGNGRPASGTTTTIHHPQEQQPQKQLQQLQPQQSSAHQWELESTIFVFQQSIRPHSASPIHPQMHHTVIPMVQGPNSLNVASSTLSVNSINSLNSLSPVPCSSDGKEVLKY